MASERRLHPLSVLFEIGGSAKELVIPGLVALFAARTGQMQWQFWAMFLIVPYALIAIGRALTFRYSLEGSELVVRSGVVFRRERHIPYDRIQNIDAVQNLAHRLLNVIEVRIETGSGGESDASLSVVTREALQEIREKVFSARGQEVSSDTGAMALPEASRGRVLLALGPRDLVVSGLVHGQGLVVIGALFGLLWEFGLMERVSSSLFGTVEESGPIRQLAAALIGRGNVSAVRIVAGVAGFLMLVLIARLLAVLRAFVRLNGFTLTLDGDDLRSEFGLATRVTATVSRRRIQTLEVHEGPLHRLFRCASIRIETAGGIGLEQAQTQREWLAPIVRRSDLDALLRAVMPAADLSDAEWQPVHPRGVRRMFVRYSIGSIAVSVVVVMLLEWWTLAVLGLLLAWNAVRARKYIEHLRWALTDSAYAVRTGWLRRRLTVVPLQKLQVIAVTRSPFDRRVGMASVHVDSAGAAMMSDTLDVPFLAASTADGLGARLTAHAAASTYRW